MNFAELMAEADSAIFSELADDATLDGQPVRGMFAAPWLAPQIGRLKTALREPHLVLRDADAVTARCGGLVEVAGSGRFDVVGIEPDGSGMTVLVLREA
ncbi:hypothetical protein LH462_11135 [Laribacter hongkongensis]|uniref:Uncharacterized protein n=1 Tax=Laribacter hongkongensis TaxID=168471 RepID=A0ABD4SUD8_9NEIS|nr:hypothetical protein [Laribacter hongkongensis]MCG9026718.1 hypothetical protein [Laribacter hongkongensis]MCG9101602.1 hypothetical protein [Laribacter hongkongensis]MCG9104272.1 hypothetical protein [Laribacter hongkongensis]MCG9113505.1 hypothetical protein [Laribacter hongkongensis]MCG9119243.1 hypothetical protein [Laribacter hongkongensis]